MKYILIGILGFIAVAFIWAIIVEFKWFFITLGVLAIGFLIVKYVMKRKKAEVGETSPDEAPEATSSITTPSKPEPKIVQYPVKGVFAHEDEIFHNLMEYNPEYDYTKAELIENCVPDFPVYKWIPKRLPAELIPEPDNKYDPNAIRVVVGGITIGYIPKESCITVLHQISEGKIDNIAYEIAGGAFKLLEEDYDPDKDKSKYSVKTGKGELYAKIYIRESR